MTDFDAQEQTALADQTVLAKTGPQDERVCPFCGKPNSTEALSQSAYVCRHCRKELAHLDYAPNGSLRGIFGWLLAPGEVVLDRYRIQSVLGKGGFGAAYLADDLQLSGKRRALKEVPAPLFDEYETSLLSRLDHPSIPDIIERRAVGEMVYLVLKFGGSRTLGSERKQHPDGRIPLAKLLPWMRQLCEVLAYLHGQDPPIIHRDLKPDNILLDDDGRIMLIDFGIAKEAVPEAMTRTLGRAATLHFSPPEQVMGTGTDERADIYALGATCYALLTGTPPPAAHERVSGKELIPPGELVPGLAPELEDAIMQALELNMNHRQQSVREFAQALEGLAADESSRPLYGEGQDLRTVPLGPSTPLARSKPTGLKLPTGRTGGSSRPAPAVAVETAPPPRTGQTLLILAAVALALAGLASGVYYYLSRPAPPPAPVAQPAPQPAPLVQPAPPAPAAPTVPAQPAGQASPAVAPPPTPTAPPLATPTPTPAPTPTPTPTPPAPTGSAEEMLKSRIPQAPEPTPVSPREEPKAKPRPKPPAPVHAAPKPARPKPQAAPEDWVIIPGGAHKTD